MDIIMIIIAMDLKRVLKDIGLGDLEAKIYLVLLESSKLSISEISRKSGIKRPTCYHYIELLLEKDYIKKIPTGKRMLYLAEDPKKILIDLKSKLHDFEQNLDELREKYVENSQKTKIIFYEGKKSIKKIYQDSFKSIGDIYSIFPPEAFLKHFTLDEYEKFELDISDHKFRIKDLVLTDSRFKDISKIKKRVKVDNKYTKKLPASFNSEVDVLIFGNKVALISLKDLSATVIENSSITDLFKNIHDFMWRVV